MLHALTLITLLSGPPDTPTTVISVDGQGNMSVVVRGLRNANGQVLYALFPGEKGFPEDDDRAVRRSQARINGSVSKMAWKDIAHGTYAIAVFHDENGNEQLDTNWVGMPTEGLGASNNAKGRMGPPKWKDAKFVHDGEVSSQVIKIVYL